jgi:predicted chitinase
MLATVKHECAGRWLPIEEYKKGGKREYARPVSVTDADGNVFTHAYYGRGYVQLTWQANYQKLGHELSMGDRLMLEPKLALEPRTSYRILSHGMRSGSFTSKKLDDFIQGSRCDYANARRIVNGTDRHLEIAGHAMRLELLLRLSAVHRGQLAS